MSDKTTNDEQQRQEPENVQQPETATGAAQEGQQPLKEEPPEREKLPEDEELLRQWEAMPPDEREKLSEQCKAIKDKLANPLEGIDTTLADLKSPLADVVNPLGDALEQWKETEAQRQQQINEILSRTTAALPDMSNISKQLSDSIRAALPDMSALSASLVESTTAAMRQIAESGLKIASFYESTSFTALQELVSGFDDYVEEREKQFEAGDFTFLGAFVDNVDELLPYIKEEIEAYKKETGKEKVTFDEFMYHATDPETGEEKASIFEKVLESAQERAEQDAAAAEAARNVAEAKAKKEEKESASSFRLKELAPAPTGPALNFMLQVFNSGMRQMEESRTNRHEHIKYERAGKTMRITRENKRDKIVLTFGDAQSFLSGKNKGFSKIFYYIMQQMNNQYFPRIVILDLQEMVDLGMYSRADAAKRAVLNFYRQQAKLEISGEIYRKDQKEPVRETGGFLFYHYDKQGSKMYLSVNENFNLEFLAQYFTLFPTFCYQLKSNAFSLTEYIFYLARQNAKAIKANGSFTISFEAIRQHLGLPTIEEAGKNRHYQQDIVRPIEAAIEEVENVIAEESKAGTTVFTLTPIVSDNADIAEWLNGRLEVRFEAEFAKTFIEIADKQEKEISAYKKAKTKERARIDARQEAKKKG